MFLNLISKKEDQVKPFGNGDRVGYALGDFGCAIFFGLVSNYLMLFYTDVLGISAAAVGTLFVVARIWDSINDPIMGVLVDKVGTTKHGKFRPYVVRFGLPMLVVGILAFTAIPGLPEGMKLPYAYVTYIVFGMLYTAVNIPYGSLASVMTSDPSERTSLSTFRTIGTMLGQLLVMYLVPKIVFAADGSVTAEGFMKCAIILATISTVAFIFNFRLTRERIVHKVSENKQSMASTLKALIKNRAFIGIALASFTLMGSMLTIGSLNAYLFKEYFHNTTLIALGGMVGIVASLSIIPFVGIIVKKLGKKESAVVGVAFTTAIYAIMFFMPNLTAGMYVILSFVSGLGTGLFNTIVWALVGDAIDYQEYITGERNEGTVYSSYSLARKLAQALSGGIGGFALSFLGYQSGVAEQLPSVGEGIKNITLGAGVIGYGATALIVLFVYNLSNKKLAEMNAELEKRRTA